MRGRGKARRVDRNLSDSFPLRGEPDWTPPPPLERVGEEWTDQVEGLRGQMEDSSQHLEHCAVVDMRELSVIPEGLTAGERITPCPSVRPSVCQLICPPWSSVLSSLTSRNNMIFCF